VHYNSLLHCCCHASVTLTGLALVLYNATAILHLFPTGLILLLLLLLL
jgi:hypothetical protein